MKVLCFRKLKFVVEHLLSHRNSQLNRNSEYHSWAAFEFTFVRTSQGSIGSILPTNNSHVPHNFRQSSIILSPSIWNIDLLIGIYIG